MSRYKGRWHVRFEIGRESDGFTVSEGLRFRTTAAYRARVEVGEVLRAKSDTTQFLISSRLDFQNFSEFTVGSIAVSAFRPESVSADISSNVGAKMLVLSEMSALSSCVPGRHEAERRARLAEVQHVWTRRAKGTCCGRRCRQEL